MLSRKSICLACAITVLTGFAARAAFAQQPLDKRTFFTFNAPVHMPGVTLGTGTYLFTGVPNGNIRVMLIPEPGSEQSYPEQRHEEAKRDRVTLSLDTVQERVDRYVDRECTHDVVQTPLWSILL